MAPSSERKPQHEVERRRLQHRKRAQLTQAQQRIAEANRELHRQMTRWSRRRLASWALMTAAVVVAAQHVVAHLGWRPIPISMGWQDLLIGYPMALLLLVLGAHLLDPHPRRL